MTDKGFDPKDHMMQLKGKDYLPVFARLMWLRTEQSGATLETDMVEHEVGKHATFKAKVTLKDGASATGWGTETVQDFRDYLEKAETKAIGRALGALGFGTAFADFVYEKDEPETKVVDSPVEPTPLRTRSPEPAKPSSLGAKLVQAGLLEDDGEAFYTAEGVLVEYEPKVSQAGKGYFVMTNRRCKTHDQPWFSFDKKKWSHGKKSDNNYHEWDGTELDAA
jgi:hypothetical protein